MTPFQNLTYLMLEANSSCNLQCANCLRSELVKDGQRSSKNLSADELIQILKQVKSCPIDTIKFQGLSEPMLHPEFDRLTGFVRGQFPRATIIISTNLQYDLESSPFLRTLSFVDMVYLSIDGTFEKYEEMRKGASYQRLIDSLDKIRTLVKESERKRQLHVNFTLTPNNYLELPKIYRLKEDFHLASVRINLAQDWSIFRANRHDFTKEIIDFLKPYRQDVKGVGGWEYKDCFWPHSGTIIDVFGNVRQCILSCNQPPLGNVFQMPLAEIFNNSEILKNARLTLANNLPPLHCETCDYNLLSKILLEIFGGKYQIQKPRLKSVVKP